MELDHRKRYASPGPDASHNAPVPGKQTLTQRMVQLHPADAPSSVRAETATTPPPMPTGPRPTLQMLFGRRVPASDPEQARAAAARGAASASSQLPHLEQIQKSFGRHDVSGVRAHVGAEAVASAQEMGAAAYATGNHVVLGAGTNLHTVAHEAAHVVQQRGGVQLKGNLGAPGDTYEQHADAVADRVVRGESAEALLSAHAGSGEPSGSGEPAVQRKPIAQGGEIYVDDVTGELFTWIQSDSLHGGRMQLKSERRVVWFYDRGPSTLYVDVAEAKALEDAYRATQAIIAKRPEAQEFDVDELFAEALDIAVFEGAMNAAIWLEDYGHAIGGSVSMQRHGIDDGDELEREFSQLAAVVRTDLSALEFAELRDEVTERAAKDGVKAAIDWIKDLVKVRQQVQTNGARQQPKYDPGLSDEGGGKGDRDRDGSSSSEDEDERKWHSGGHGTPGGSPGGQPDPNVAELAGKVPTEVWQLILRFMSGGDRGSLTSMRLVSRWFYSIAENTTTNEVWYGLHSEQNNRTRWNVRPVCEVDPLDGRINGQGPGAYREGPCKMLVARLLVAMRNEDGFDNCMVGALLGISGRLYVTVSGTVPYGFRKFVHRTLNDDRLQVVETGKLSEITNEPDSVMSIYGGNIKGYGGKLGKQKFHNHPHGSETGEIAKTPPGTCALPKLIEACRDAGDAPKYASEQWYTAPKDNTTVRVLDGDELRDHSHGDSVPSCINCRSLTKAQLRGISSSHDSKAHALRKKDDERHEMVEEEQLRLRLAREEREERERQAKEHQAEEITRAARACGRASIAFLDAKPAQADDVLDHRWETIVAAAKACIDEHCDEIGQTEPEGEDEVITLEDRVKTAPKIVAVVTALRELVAAVHAVDLLGTDGWLELDLAWKAVFELIKYWLV